MTTAGQKPASSDIFSSAEHVRFAAGETIFKEGEPGEQAFFIVQGLVRISILKDGHQQELSQLGEGELFGEMSLIDSDMRSATATAAEETTLVPISREHFQNKLTSTDPLTRYFLRVILRRFKRAQAALLSAGIEEQNRPHREMHSHSETQQLALKEVTFIQQLKEAIDSGRMAVHFQPIFNIGDSQVVGFEALVRWPQADGKLVSPMEFIPIAEESGLIVDLGYWVLQQSVVMLGHCLERSDNADLFMSINVSPRQLKDEKNVERLIKLIQKGKAPAGNYKLEITESALMEDPNAAYAALSRLKEAGVQLAIDDFGTGYSSLSYLQRYPLDILKIDRAFVDAMLRDGASMKIVRAIVSLARELGLATVGEGIELEQHRQQLQQLGCLYGQGYLVSKPLPPAQVLALL